MEIQILLQEILETYRKGVRQTTQHRRGGRKLRSSFGSGGTVEGEWFQSIAARHQAKRPASSDDRRSRPGSGLRDNRGPDRAWPGRPRTRDRGCSRRLRKAAVATGAFAQPWYVPHPHRVVPPGNTHRGVRNLPHGKRSTRIGMRRQAKFTSENSDTRVAEVNEMPDRRLASGEIVGGYAGGVQSGGKIETYGRNIVVARVDHLHGLGTAATPLSNWPSANPPDFDPAVDTRQARLLHWSRTK